jgi:RND superfamily putative drug exporter
LLFDLRAPLRRDARSTVFHSLGRLIVRIWPLLLGVWVAVLAGVWAASPPWDAVAESGQFAFLPADSPSIRGQDLFRTAFPAEPLGSSIVLVLSLPGDGLRAEDRAFIDNALKAGLKRLQEAEESPPIISRIRAPTDPGTGPLLVSEGRKAALVVVELTAEFLDRRTWPVVAAVEELADRLRQDEKVPAGVDIAFTGSAVVGRDFRQAETKSAETIQTWTVILVVVLLLVIYRAPVLALVPILTVALAVKVSLCILALMAAHGLMTLSETTRVYISVLAYGAGVDYCLFLTARYREELDAGVERRAALAAAVGKVGATVAASAATVIAGIAMLAFGRFGKYHQAGVCIPLALAVVLIAALTFAPALLRPAGQWAFWPRRWPGAGRGTVHGIWEWTGRLVTARPGTVWLASAAIMLPFAAVAFWNGGRWDYGILGGLPPTAPSVAGTHQLAEHFAPGVAGPVTVLIRADRIDFKSAAGGDLVASLTTRLADRKDDLGLADVRSFARPLGVTSAAKEALADLPVSGAAAEKVIRERAAGYYVSRAGGLTGHVTRIDLVPNQDPLTRAGIDELGQIETAVWAALPDQLRTAAIEFVGAATSLRDLRDVTTGDLRRAQVLVPAVVFVILVVLLRKLGLSLYLVLTVLFSYLATLGVTLVVFWALDPAGFSGLDWKVPIFLFTILVAVGEDYNIFLLGRVREEESRHGPVGGVTAALVSTGGIISSCGVIMAGTFASLWAGTLAEMKQLGFALAFGVLLDTLVVRPLLVPAFLILARSAGTAAPRAQAASSTRAGYIT